MLLCWLMTAPLAVSLSLLKPPLSLLTFFSCACAPFVADDAVVATPSSPPMRVSIVSQGFSGVLVHLGPVPKSGGAAPMGRSAQHRPTPGNGGQLRGEFLREI